MNSPYLTEEHEMLRAQVRRFVQEEIVPYGDQWEKDGETPRSLIRKMGELGMLGVRFPEKLGGSGMDVLSWIILAEELGHSTYGGVTTTIMVSTAMAAPHLVNAGTEEQLKKYAPGIISGDLLCAIGVSEPDAGSDVGALRTNARRDGDDWILNGTKLYITNGSNADLVFVAARTDPKATGARGVSMFIVEKGMPGFSVARRLSKMGDHCNETAELVFDDCRVPAANLLGEEGRGFYATMQNFQGERLVVAAMAMGEALTALQLTLDYTRIRKTFGLPLIERQVVRQKLAMLHAKVEAGRQFLYHTAWLDSQGMNPIQQVSMCKAYCCEVVNEVMYACQQFHGGFGYMRESKIERMVRDARLHAIGGGATEVMLDEVAKRWDEQIY
ncbi:acyl-CoA dehydrogenase family protein [Rhizorhapis sp. SPR117]|uniref:acyl-CoA dehydrogenase family protein n=1 Tax=Rhizorhapis sp. SPR117 TaxID=2912611 RepID=UPI001F16FD64|nr:acyl-CoA dehydrogenase family protein [Rhizorhapis sp. SPR117]